MNKIEIALLEDIIQAVKSDNHGAKYRLKKNLYTLRNLKPAGGNYQDSVCGSPGAVRAAAGAWWRRADVLIPRRLLGC